MNRGAILPVAPVTAAKFFPDGRPRPYPGNTVSAAFIADRRPERALRAVVAALRRHESSGTFCFLPPATWHVTVLRGINDRMRAPGDWPRGIARDATLDAATRCLRRRLGPVFPPRQIVTTAEALEMNADGDIRLVLRAAGTAQFARLERLKRTLQKVLGHRRRDGGGPMHLTLAYRTRPIPWEAAHSIEAALDALWNEYRPDLVTLRFGKPGLIRYESMLDFRARRY